MNKKQQDYDAFVEKFKPKLTTDDCYTPAEIYDTVLNFVRRQYNVSPSTPIVRPFWPGGDYESFDYPPDCIVIDNPPFSIYSKIVRHYIARGIRFFLFAPSLTAFVYDADVTYLITDNEITYANGAKINTAFVTNLMPGVRVWTAPELAREIDITSKKMRCSKQVRKLCYSRHVTTSALILRIALQKIDYTIKSDQCVYIRKTGEDKHQIYGSGLLLSNTAVAERQAAERQAAERQAAVRQAARMKAENEIKLTQAELSIIATLK